MSTSIVIPVRNQPACVEWTLSSLTRQTGGMEDVEVVVVDDSSTDSTADVVRRFTDRLNLHLIVNDRHRGRSSTRNRGAEAATGEHLIFLDSDSYAPPDLISRHRKWFATGPGDLVMGRRVEMSWWSLETLARGGREVDPLPFEADQRESRGLDDTENDFHARTPWLFVATHNMSIRSEVFRAVGGFDAGMTGWGYEDNEFAYRVFRFFDRKAGHFVYDPDLVCYHMPHFRDWTREWANTADVLPYIKNKHRHFDVELLSHPPNHLRIAQTLPYYEEGISRLASTPAPVARLAELLPPAGAAQLWIGHGVTQAGADGRAAHFFDHSRDHGDDNPHLLGTFLPYRDRELSAVIAVDLWRLLSPMDLSELLIEGLRAAGEVHLVLSKSIASDPDRRLGLASDAGYLIAMFASRFHVDVPHDDHELTILRCRPLTAGAADPG